MTNIECITLDNGLKIYFYIDKRRHSTFFQHITLFGGKTKDFIVDGKEYHMQDGIAHILEHYIVEENSNGNFLKVLGEKQMSTNASTYYDMTNYYFEAVEDVEFGIRTMINGIYSPIFDKDRLEKIKKPILQEIRSRSNNKFYHGTIETFNNTFNKIKVRSIGGSLEDVQNTSLEDIITCFEAFYQPSNQFIVVGGNFDKDSVLNTIKEVYDELDIKMKDVMLIKMNENNQVLKKYGVVEFPTGEEYLEVNFKINLSKFSVKERLKLDFYIHYFFQMFFGVTSSVYKKLVQEKIITSSINCGDFTLDDFLILSIGAYSSKSDLLNKCILDTINDMDNFDEEMFEIYKKESILNMILRNENLYDTIIPFVNNIVIFNYPYPDKVSDIEEFNFTEFVKMIKSLDFSNYTVTVIKNPNKEKESSI